MLSVTRKTGQVITIGDDIRIHVAKAAYGVVRLNIDAPKELLISCAEPSEREPKREPTIEQLRDELAAIDPKQHVDLYRLVGISKHVKQLRAGGADEAKVHECESYLHGLVLGI